MKVPAWGVEVPVFRYRLLYFCDFWGWFDRLGHFVVLCITGNGILVERSISICSFYTNIIQV